MRKLTASVQVSATTADVAQSDDFIMIVGKNSGKGYIVTGSSYKNGPWKAISLSQFTENRKLVPTAPSSDLTTFLDGFITDGDKVLAFDSMSELMDYYLENVVK